MRLIPVCVSLALLLVVPAVARERDYKNNPADQPSAQPSVASNKGQSGAKGDEANGKEESPDTEDMFGFTVGTDVIEKGALEVSSEVVSSLGKRFGHYQADAFKSTFTFSPIEGLSIEPGVISNHFSVRNVPDLNNQNFTGFGGLSTEIKWQVLKRNPSPFGLTFLAQPNMSFLEEDTGVRGRGQGLETRLLLDTALIPNAVYAGFNAIYEMDKFRQRGVRLFSREGEELDAPLAPCGVHPPKVNITQIEGESANADIETVNADEAKEPCTAFARRRGAERSSKLGFSGALAFQAFPNVFLGAEVRYFRAYEGLTLQHFRGEAVFVGPTLFAKLSEKLGITAAFSTQVAGHAVGVPGRLDLDNFSHYQARLKIFYEF